MDNKPLGVVLDPQALYTEDQVIKLLPFLHGGILERARKEGALRFQNKGQGRSSCFVYFGDWLITWLRQLPKEDAHG